MFELICKGNALDTDHKNNSIWLKVILGDIYFPIGQLVHYILFISIKVTW